MSVALACLAALSLLDYLVFHTFAELSTVAVGLAALALAWNVRQRLENGFLLYVAMVLAVVATIDLVHALAYHGMGVFPDAGPNLPTQLWIAGRYLQALGLLSAPFWLTFMAPPWARPKLALTPIECDRRRPMPSCRTARPDRPPSGRRPPRSC